MLQQKIRDYLTGLCEVTSLMDSWHVVLVLCLQQVGFTCTSEFNIWMVNIEKYWPQVFVFRPQKITYISLLSMFKDQLKRETYIHRIQNINSAVQ